MQEDVEKRKLVKAEQNKIALRTAMDVSVYPTMCYDDTKYVLNNIYILHIIVWYVVYNLHCVNISDYSGVQTPHFLIELLF